jgi:hypothetical protein
VEARVVHYKAELQTSPELDAVTEQVVRQLKELQQAASREALVPKDPASTERAQTSTLERLLRDALVTDENYIIRAIQPIGKRLAKRFFEREVDPRNATNDRLIHHAEQGVYLVLNRYTEQFRADLEGLAYVSEEMKSLTFELLAKLQRDIQVGFLSRRSTELNRAMSVFTSVLVEFFQSHLPQQLKRMSEGTIKTAASARQPDSLPYKIRTEGFQKFREAWECTLMTEMITYCSDRFSEQLRLNDGDMRQETVQFFTSPFVFSETCDVVCNELYDRLCMEGFLDIPIDWRSRENLLSQAR